MIGNLKVVVVQGKRLVVRDFKSSDPYVILTLGDQVAKTKVIKSCLNPVWNEELSFCLLDPLPTLYLVSLLSSHFISWDASCFILDTCVLSHSQEVFDKDRFKADDKMGYAHLNIQPLASAARLKHVLQLSSPETTLRKLIPDPHNCLLTETSINCVDGHIVQDVWLRLCGVESGEIQLKLKLLETPSPPTTATTTTSPST